MTKEGRLFGAIAIIGLFSMAIIWMASRWEQTGDVQQVKPGGVPLLEWTIAYQIDGYDENVVWAYALDTSAGQRVKYVIGNQDHTSFLQSSVEGGFGTIPILGQSVSVFPDLQTAKNRLNKMASGDNMNAPEVVSADEVEIFVASEPTFEEGGYVDFGNTFGSGSFTNGGSYGNF
jgi:hypothetical protein